MIRYTPRTSEAEYLEELERDKAREEEALRNFQKYYDRPGWFLNGKDLLWFVGKVLLIGAIGWLIVAGFLSL